MSELKPCPFCGCEMSSDANYFMNGKHPESCYFYFVDNPWYFDFRKPEDLAALHRAWNGRIPHADDRG